jgi:hypothetical protein
MAMPAPIRGRVGLLSILFVSFALFGCATAHSTAGRDFDTYKVNQIVKGQTTSDDIVAMFGTPQSKQPKDADTVMWVYSYAEATAHAQAGFFGSREVETTGTKKVLYVLIGPDNKVVNYTLDQGPVDKRTTTAAPGY